MFYGFAITLSHISAPEQVAYVQFGARRLEEVTCLKFIAYDQDVHRDYIVITGNSSGCFNSVGQRGGRQVLNLQPFASGLDVFVWWLLRTSSFMLLDSSIFSRQQNVMTSLRLCLKGSVRVKRSTLTSTVSKLWPISTLSMITGQWCITQVQLSPSMEVTQ